MSEEELKVLLRQNIELNKKSLEILQKMNRARIMGNVFWILKWVLIIGISYGAYWYIEPYLKKYLEVLQSVSGGVNKINEVSENLNQGISADLLKGLENLLPKN
ncbi:MAG: hypothetical protein L6Q29_04440 [Candidatus Pacebacteria bacterium]|nr:hypothetical protein [Candidatus Paceibacterota bacterium]NUQ57536.1 hypothetical protein [Candidatus Paceibacter sp.]